MTKKYIFAAIFSAVACGYGYCAETANNAGLISLILPDGAKVVAELALTPEAQARGLMFRGTLPGNAGMLFVFEEDGPRSFWMKNTYISLDIIFLDSNMRVRKVFHRVPASKPEQPEAEVARVSADARFVLELAAGTARSRRVRPGALIKTSPPLIQKAAAGAALSTEAARVPARK